MSAVRPSDVPPLPRQDAFARQDSESEIDLVSLWRGMRAQWLWVALLAAGLALIAFIWSRAQPVVYEASASVIASSAQSQIGVVGGSVVSPLPVKTVEQVLQSPLILRPLIEAVQKNAAILPAERREIVLRLERGLSSSPSKDSRKKSVSVSADSGAGENSVYTLRARAPSASAARLLVDQASALLLSWDAGRTAQDVRLARDNFALQLNQIDRRLALPSLSTLERQTLVYRRATMQDNLAQLSFLESVKTSSLKPLASAVTPLKPVSPSALRNAALFGVLGLFLGGGLAALRTVTRPFVQTEDDLLALGLPVLGVLPRPGKKAGPLQENSAALEAIGFVRVRLLSALSGKPSPVVLVAGVTESGAVGGGAVSRLVSQLALSLAETGLRVMIVQVPGRRDGSQLQPPALNRIAPRRPELAKGQAKSDWQPLGNVQVAEIGAGVHLLPADLIAKLPGHADLTANLRTWSQTYDLVLLDSPPLLDQADSLTLGQHADGTLLVTGAGQTSLSDLKRVLRSAAALDMPLVGCVLDQSPAPARKAQTRSAPSAAPSAAPAVTEGRTGDVG